MKKYLKWLDIFGHSITLNVNQRKGDKNKTLYSGIASGIIRLAMLSIFLSGLYQIFSVEKYFT